MYKIKEIYYTLQCEGFHTGRPAVFVRFSGCNLWSGKEEDRANAICQFCDTDFWGMDGILGGKYDGNELKSIINNCWKGTEKEKFVVFTGGEPMLQLDQKLIDLVHEEGFEIAVETNGTKPIPNGIDWLCFSPKANSDICIDYADEIKIIHPQKGIDPLSYSNFNSKHFYLQPMDDEYQDRNIQDAVNFCMEYPQWKLSVQWHKMLGID